MAAALVAAALALLTTPALCAETATADDTAHFLAGLPPAADSPLAPLAKDPFWRQHARNFDSMFAREDSNGLSKVRAFSREYLTDKHETMLYMFSGPDFLYATSFFSSASTYVLAGLEPVGDIPQLTGLTRGTIAEMLQNLERSLGTILNISFFITNKMRTQLASGPVHGTLPVLYVFLARTGKTIHDVSFVSIDPEGNLQTLSEPGAPGAGKHALRVSNGSAAKGVKIVFSQGDGPKQTLYYFSTNLADGGVRRSGFLAFCAMLGPADSFIKSASYLLHNGGFSTVRRFLLDHSATILQDDSGIPLAYFDRKKWQLRPFGRYVGPISLFGGDYQTRLAEMFRSHAIPIDFGIGYRWRRNESNLLLAEKIAANTSDAELAPSLPRDGYPPVADNPVRRRVHRKHAAKAPAGLSCGFPGIFSFCSNLQRQ